jgi:beta-glucosidase
VPVRREDLAYWDTRIDGWVVEGGTYSVEVGASSRDIRSVATVAVEGDALNVPLTMNSSIGELIAHPVAGPIVLQALSGGTGEGPDVGGALLADPSMFKMMASFPIGRLASFPGMPVSLEQVEQLIAASNGQGA